MNTTTQTKIKLTTKLDADVYMGLQKKVGSRGIGQYISKLIRPFVVEEDLDAAYKEMSLDSDRKKEASEWIEGDFEELKDENVWQF